MNLKELQGQREQLIAQAREALDEIRANTDDGRAAELEQRHDTIMDELDRLDRSIEREQRHEATLARVEQRMEDAERRAREDRRPGGHGEQRGTDAPGGGEITYRSAFASFLRAGGDVGELTAEERQVLRAGYAAGREEQRVLTAGTATAGGYTVPNELMNEIVKTMKDWGPMLDPAVARVITTASGNPMTVPTIDDTSGTAGLHTEGGSVTDDGGADPVFGQKSLSAYVYDTEWVRVSLELLQDSMLNMEGFVGELLGERLARKANAILTTGTGSSQPGGVAALASTGKTAASATAVTADELIDLQHSVNAAYRRSPKCRWMFADSSLKAIRKLKDGNGQYIFQSANIALGTPAQLLDFPYSINDDMPAMTTGLDAFAFGDFSRFWVRLVGAPIVGVARERFFPDIGLLGLIRLDGELVDTGAIKVLTMA